MPTFVHGSSPDDYQPQIWRIAGQDLFLKSTIPIHMLRTRSVLPLLLCLLAGFGSYRSAAQMTANIDLPALESPYSTIYTHLYFLQPDTYDPLLSARSLYGISDSIRARNAAIQLKQVFDGKGLFVDLESLPKNRNFRDSTTQKSYFTPFPQALPEVYLEKVDSSWYYSRETVALLDQLHREVYPLGSNILVNLFPHIGQGRFLGLATWQYVGILILLLFTYLINALLSRMINPLIGYLTRRYLGEEGTERQLVWKAASYLSMLIILALLRMLVPTLLLPIQLAELTHKGLLIASTIILVLFLFRTIDLVMIYVRSWAASTEQKYDEQLLPIVRTTLIIIVVLGGLFQILNLLNVNVTALIAGVSIGGLALALAAQDTVKNLIGSAIVFTDRPFQIGDYIEWGGQAGTVEQVGFRSTRIRTGDTSLISVPNGTIANVAVTNKGMRTFRLFHLTPGVTYNTPPALVEQFIEGLHGLAKAHPMVNAEISYIYFNNMSASSLDIMFRVYLDVPSYAAELRTKEELLLGILRLAEVLGVHFAFPSSSVYVEQFPEKKVPPAPFPNPADRQGPLADFLQQFEKAQQPPPSA